MIKALHFSIGALVTFIIGNMAALQDGLISWDFVLTTFTGVIVTMVFELMKELIVMDKFEWGNFLAVFAGSLLPVIANMIGTVFYILSH